MKEKRELYRRKMEKTIYTDIIAELEEAIVLSNSGKEKESNDAVNAIKEKLEKRIYEIEKMKEAVKYFEGEHDFKAFRASGTSSKSSVRKIYKAEVKEMPNEKIYIELTGNGFLYNMVRIIAGTLVDVGLGKIEPKEIENIIKSKKRENAGKTLQPQGLYLLNVEYEECKQ